MSSKDDSKTQHDAIKRDVPAPDSPIRPGAAGNPYAMPVTQPPPTEQKSQPSQPAPKPQESGNEDPGAETEEIRHHGQS